MAILVFVLLMLRCADGAAIKKEGKRADVLILGAGIAGVTAARTLSENGIHNFRIIEATNRVGGRIKETQLGDTTVELGAAWIGGIDGNPMYDLALKSNVKGVISDYDDWRVIDEGGKDVTKQADAADRRNLKATKFALNYRNKFLNLTHHSDYSMSSMMGMGGWKAKNAIDEVVEYFNLDYCTAVPGEQSSIRYFWGARMAYPYGDKELFILNQKGGFSTIVRHILDAVPGKFAIVTFSLGVLQNEAVKFIPSLPMWKRVPIMGFTWAIYYHIYLRFPSDGKWFVPKNTEWTVYASEQRGYYPIWLNFEKLAPGSRIMMCEVTNDEARRLNRLSDNEVKAEAMAVLRTLFGDDIPEAGEVLMNRWMDDPFTFGSYADWPPGFNLDDFSALKAPVGRLYFAGDAYHDDFGFTNGAHLASIRETTQLVKCLKNPKNCTKFTPSTVNSNI